MEKGCFKVLMVASQPARQRSARRNQRCFCCWARLVERRPRAGSATFLTPRACASCSFLAKKTPVAGGHLRRSPEAGLMLLQGRNPGCGIVRIARENLVAAHDAVFYLVNAHQSTKLVGPMRFPFANDCGVRFEQTQDFALYVAVSSPHPLLGLRHHLLHQRKKVP